MKKHIYKWHRTISLIIALPVLLWASSGFMHPLMTNIRPAIATQWLPPHVIDTSTIKISLQNALQKNYIDKFSAVRLIAIANQQFYQVQLTSQPTLIYLSTQNGRRLPKGDELYARYLARQFLEGAKPAQEQHSHPLLATLQVPAAATPGIETDDCCRNATSTVLDETTGVKITGVELVEQFDNEYKYINRLLPVYKISFARRDGIRVYVETGQDRFAFAMDNKRAVFDKLFTLFHTLGWLDALGRFKHVIEFLIMLMAFSTTVMGICIFCISKTKKPNGNEVLKARRNHRWTSILVSLFTLMFTFSGGYHAFSKISPDDSNGYFVKSTFHPQDAALDINRLQSAIGSDKRISNIALVKCNDTLYWQVYNAPPAMNNNPPAATKDLIQRMTAAAPTTLYVRESDYSLLPQGEEKYARYLATVFSKHTPETITATTLVTKFAGEYGFVNKRLPVWKISYATNSNERFYIETSTGKLAARIDDKALVEGYSFALLHKHEFMAWAGKPVKDFSTMFWAAAQVAMVVVGLVLYTKSRKRRSRPQ